MRNLFLLAFMFYQGVSFIGGFTGIGAAEITADDLVYYTEHSPPPQLHEKFIRDRFKLICYVKNTYFEYFTGQGIAPKKFKEVYQISLMKSGFGFSKKIPLSLIQKFQTALEELKADNSVARILKKYSLD